jgi:general secretion pathway protein G
MRRWVSNEKGFTLVELMVVVIIIGVLAAISIPVVYQQVDQAKQKRAIAEIKTMKTTVDIYRMEKSVFPTTGEVVGVFSNAGIEFADMYDPWDNPYVYSTVNASPVSYVILSGGPDGQMAGEDNIAATEAKNPLDAQDFESLADSIHSGTSEEP